MTLFQWKRLVDVTCLPFHLVELLEKEHFTTEEFYDYLSRNLWLHDKGYANPHCQLWVMIKEKENIPKGFCWLSRHPLTQKMSVEGWVLDPVERKKCKPVAKLKELLDTILQEEGMSTVYWVTKAREAAKKQGFTSSKKDLMEYSKDKEETTLCLF